MLSPDKWLLLLYGLPTKNSGARVNLWRQLKKTGALPFKTSASLLPDTAEHYERFQWLAQQVRDAGGEATLVRVMEIEGLTNEQLARLFNDARAEDYKELTSSIAAFIKSNQKRWSESHVANLEKLTQRFNGIRQIDYFDSPAAQDAQMMLRRAEGLARPKGSAGKKLETKQFVAKTWLTRPRPEIDRVGSAWLIRKFIDPKARFIFATDAKKFPEAIPYDMVDVEFSHHGEDCTFETLVKRFGISDKGVLKMAEMVHEADLEDGKFGQTECVGLDRVLKGWAKRGLSDEQLLEKGAECFDALYEFLRK